MIGIFVVIAYRKARREYRAIKIIKNLRGLGALRGDESLYF